MGRAPDSLSGEVLDERYQVGRLLGRGGMGSVYRGEHLLMRRPVAIKVLVGEDGGGQGSKRFAHEARSAFELDHPHCVRVTDFGATSDGLLYIIMEYLDGRTLGEELQVDGILSIERTAHIGTQVADALSHAHQGGLVHRDIKPDNIMLIHRGEDPDFAKVLDFGLAKLVSSSKRATTTALSMANITQDGMTYGTPHYMAPEQALGEQLDGRTDVYGLGCVLYHLLTGTTVFRGETTMDLLMAQVKHQPEALRERNPEVPPALASLIMSCLDKTPANRPHSAELADALRTLSMSTPTIPAPARPASQKLRSQPTEALSIAHPSPSDSPLSTQAALSIIRPKTGLYLALAGLASLAFVATLLVWLRSDSGTVTYLDAGLPDAAAHAHLSVAADARAPDPQDASTDAAPPVAVDAGKRIGHREPTATPRDPKVEKLIQKAEQARRSRNTLGQMAAADAALRLEPKDARARYLFAEALIRSGENDQGCRELRVIRRRRRARSLALKSSCPWISKPRAD